MDVPIGCRERLRWYVVATKRRQEDRAEISLNRLAVQTCLPKFREHVAARHRQRPGVYRPMPLFPGYIFARFDVAASFTKVCNTRGVRKVVGLGEHATPVDDAIIAQIQNSIEKDGFVRMAELRPGDAVRILDGPLRSFSGVFERTLRGRDRVLILLNTIGGGARAEMPSAFVCSATPLSITRTSVEQVNPKHA